MTKFLIQIKDGRIIFDFQFQLLQAIDYQNWYGIMHGGSSLMYDMIDYNTSIEEAEAECIPIGSVEFGIQYLKHFHNIDYKPIAIPIEIDPQSYPDFWKRRIATNEHDVIMELFSHCPETDQIFVKQVDKPKGLTGIYNCGSTFPTLEPGEYLVSPVVEIDSEWRCFVYEHKLVGVHNYAGDFTAWPDIPLIKEIISAYQSAPIAYTLDVGINKNETFIIEIHDFMSCGLYGFADDRILPQMYIRWWREYLKHNATKI